jgi:hypothetical protein
MTRPRSLRPILCLFQWYQNYFQHVKILPYFLLRCGCSIQTHRQLSSVDRLLLYLTRHTLIIVKLLNFSLTHLFCDKICLRQTHRCVIPRFRRNGNEIFPLLCCYGACVFSLLPTFRDNCFTLEDETVRLSWTLVTNKASTLRNIPEQPRSQTQSYLILLYR